MMGKLFCLSVFGRKSKVSKAVTCTNVKNDSKGLDIALAKKDAVSKLPLFVKDTVMPPDTVTNSPTCKEGDVDVGEGEALPCKSQIGADQESFASTSQSSCMSGGHQAIHPEEASIHAKEAISDGKGSQEILVPHSVQFTCGSYGDSADKSDSEALGSECTDSSKRPRNGAATPVAYAGSIEKGIFCKIYTEGGIDLSGGLEEARRDAIFRYSPDKAIMSIKCEKFAWDDEALGGHASDPGVYQGEEMESLNGFSVLLDDGSAMHSLRLEGSPNPDSVSRVSVDAAENLSVETCGHCSEPTYHIVEVMDPRPDNMSAGHLSRSLTAELNKESSDTSPVREGNHKQQQNGYSSDLGEGNSNIFKMARNFQKLKVKANNAEEAGVGIFTVALGPQSLSINVPSAESSLSRVKEWISTIQQPDTPFHEPVPGSVSEINEEVGDASGGFPDAVTMDRELASAAIRSLPAYSTVAHMAGIGLREVPSLAVFNCLKTLNLSANSITRVLAGYLPQSLHTLDLSRNRIAQIEGFRDLTRLRVLNLSHNRISRIGHGLANCTLIKELYLAGNKIAEVDGLHRLLKLSVLDLSHNKVATSKALGQLAANYSSLLALNLLGNPILVNVGEDQLRKLVGSLTPHVTYLNKQPIKAVSVREAVVDNVARAALGTSQRNNKSSSSKASRKVAGVQSSATSQKKLPSRRAKDVEKRPGSSSGRASRQHHHHHSHHHRDSTSVQHNDKVLSKEQGYSLGTPLREHLLRNLALDTRGQSMHRSRSDGALQEE